MKVPCKSICCPVLFLNKIFSSRPSEADQFEKEALELHNKYRYGHASPPLVLSKELTKISQAWAETLAKNDALAYSNNPKYGESVYCGWSGNAQTKVTAQDCVDKWYSEINEYPFGTDPETLNCGHFTQIVWKNTKEIGVGSAKSKSGKLYVVANYNPPGNYSGQFKENVLPPGANQFKSTYKPQSDSLRVANNNVPSSSPNRNSKIFSGVASDLVNKLKSTSISGEFEQDCLQAHNDYRRKHGVPPLVISKKLNKYAEEWAKVLVKKGKMEHRVQSEYGENIFYAWSTDPNFQVSGRDAVDKWYAEIKDHTFGQEPKTLASGHFTQVIWEDSKEVGVGVARSKDGHVYVVANYFPPGNVIGSFSKKVPPPN